MWSITRGLMKRSRRTLVPAGIAIAIGSLFICATLLLGNVLDSSSTKNFTAAYGGADYSVSLTNESDNIGMLNDDGSLKDTLKSTGMNQIGQVQGVDDTRYSLMEYEQVSSSAGQRNMTAIEISAHHSIMPVELTQGDWPGKAGEAAVDETAATALGVSPGDKLTLIDSSAIPYGTDSTASAAPTGTPSVTVTVTGLTHDPEDQYSLSGGTIVVTPDDMLSLYKNANATVSMPNIAQLTHDDLPADTVYYSVAKGANASDVRKAVNAKLTGAQVKSRSEAADERLKEMNGGGINPVTAAILAFGVLAMFVAALVIANTFRVLVTQRRRTLALLRTIGASKSQVHRSVLTEGTLLGLEYSVIGTAIACLVVGILDLANVEISGEPIEFIPSASSILVPIVFATLITLLASTGAARSATMVSPMEALRPIDTTEKRSIKATRGVVAVLLLVIGIALAVNAITKAHHFAQVPADLTSASNMDQVMPLFCAILAAMLTFIGLALSSQVWVPWVLAGLGKLASLIGGKHPQEPASRGGHEHRAAHRHHPCGDRRHGSLVRHRDRQQAARQPLHGGRLRIDHGFVGFRSLQARIGGRCKRGGARAHVCGPRIQGFGRTRTVLRHCLRRARFSDRQRGGGCVRHQAPRGRHDLRVKRLQDRNRPLRVLHRPRRRPAGGLHLQNRAHIELLPGRLRRHIRLWQPLQL